MADPIIQITKSDANEIIRARNKVDGVRAGPGIIVKHTPEGMVVSQAPRRPRVIPSPQQEYGRILSSSQDGSNYRWTYTMELVEKTGTGFDSWTKRTGTSDVTAYNGLEAPNGATGVVGTGIDLDSLPAGFELQPIGVGAVLPIEFVYSDGTTIEYQFTAANSPDGECE